MTDHAYTLLPECQKHIKLGYKNAGFRQLAPRVTPAHHKEESHHCSNHILYVAPSHFFNTSNDGKLKVPRDPNKSMANCSLKLTVVNLTEIENAVIQSDPLRSTHKHSTHRNACEHSDWYSKHAVSSTESQQLLVAARA